ncbi:MAG: SDR family oxidoreductase [Candidatus Kapaibacterium sp.]
MKEIYSLKGKKALITGGTKGIGLAITKLFLELGADVFIAARNKNLINEMIKTYKDKELSGVAADISKLPGIEKMMKEVLKKWDRVDILVNNAGFNIRKKSVEYTEKEFDTIINTNLKSVFRISVRMLPLLMKSKSSTIVNISSVAGMTALKTGSPYAITKAGIIQVTKNLAVEWAQHGIRVNTIAPWYIKTPLTEKLLNDRKYLKSILERTPMGRYGETEEVANVAAFLASDASSYVTGQCIAVDGGFSVYGF